MKKRLLQIAVLAVFMVLIVSCTNRKEEDFRVLEGGKMGSENKAFLEIEPEEIPEEVPEYEPQPEETDGSSETTTYIPQDFLKLLEEVHWEDKAVEVLSPMVSDKVLNDEELQGYLSDEQVAEYKEQIDEHGGIFLLVDADNDGIEDMFVWLWNGGSMGNSSRYLLQGQADGSFRCTVSDEDITQEICFVEYQGKNYLIETLFDYNMKVLTGFKVTYFQDGIIYEEVTLETETVEYVPKISYQEAGYEKMAEVCAEEGKNGFRTVEAEEIGGSTYYFEAWQKRIGSGEREVANSAEICEKYDIGKYSDLLYSADINNDGTEEWYWKSIFYPSNISTVLCLEEGFYSQDNLTEEWSLLERYALGYDGVPLMFWVEDVKNPQVGRKQIVCILCYGGQSYNVVYGYLIEGENVKKVMEIEYIGNQEMTYGVQTISQTVF